MESLFDPVLKLVGFIWDSVSRHISYARDLRRKVTALSTEANNLRSRRDEIQAQVQAAVSVGKTKKPRVENWLEDVEDILRDVASIESDFQQGGSCFLGHCPDLRWRLKLGKKIEKKMKVVEQLLQQGVFDNVAESPRRPLMTEWQVPSQLEQQSTSQQTLQEIEQALSDEEIGIVSVCGMGGIGKTTLMKKAYNRLLETRTFNVVLWVTVSKDLNLNVIQQKIGNELGLKFDEHDGTEEKRDKLYARLMNVKYMLILDDLWQRFSLDDMGIPQPDKENHCKIAITTRSVEVGNWMEAHSIIRVKTLSSVEAWELFHSKTGDVVLQPEIQELAKEVVEECGGLPLAIKTVGGSLRRKAKKELWQNALYALRASAVTEVPGMQREVFLPLKLSYDYLEDPKIQLCFLYCSLYPEDFEIPIEKLVKCWAFEEGLIDNVTGLDQALKRGHGILERLKDACLLEEGASASRICLIHADTAYVKMHDLLRDLAIWITSQSFSSSSLFQSSKFLTKTGEGLEQPPEEKIWEGMRRISLMRNEIRELRIIPNCPDLVSLFLADQQKSDRLPITIHDSFFQLMPKLQILDLSYTGIESLPPSLSLLVNLSVLDVRYCGKLRELPPLGDLKKLQLLDLSWSGIINLPQGTASLATLKCLDLSCTGKLPAIFCNIISGMTSLVDLRLLGCKISVDAWRKIATLGHLTCLTIQLPSFDAFTVDDLKHPMWSRLSSFYVNFGFPHYGLNVMPFDRKVLIYNCQGFPSQIKSLIGIAEYLCIEQCDCLDNLSQIIGDSKNLKCIWLVAARGVKCCIDWREVGGNKALDSLEQLKLKYLRSLQKVFDGGPPKGFHQLRKISIESCLKLTSIFSSIMIQHLQQLEELVVTCCIEIEEIVEGSPVPDMALPRLSSLTLWRLPKLTTICSQPLVLKSIDQNIFVEDCPKLKRLPVLCSQIREIKGGILASRECWEGIDWEDEHSKCLYSTIYNERPYSPGIFNYAEKVAETEEDDSEVSEPEPVEEAETDSDL